MKTMCANLNVLGHLFVLQDSPILLLPVQERPPYAGTGLLHVRVLDLLPLPQVLVHVVHPGHVAQLPFTTKYS